MNASSNPLAAVIHSIIQLLTGQRPPPAPLASRHERREAARIRQHTSGGALWTRADRHPNPRKGKRVVNDLGGISGDSTSRTFED